MSAKCNIKDKIEIYNNAVESFKKALLSGGGKTDSQSVTRALNYALNDTQKKNKDFDFEPTSLINPIVEQLKANGILAEDYDFSKNKRKKKEPTAEQIAEKEAERAAKEKVKQEEAWKNKIRKITEKADGLDEKQREDYAHKLYSKFVDEGILSHQDTRDIFSKITGKPHMNDRIDNAVAEQAANAQSLEELNKKRDEIIEKINEATKANKNGKLDKDQDAEYSRQLNELKPKLDAAKEKVIKSSLALANEMHSQDFWLWNYNQRMRLNLMSATSLIRNATGAIPDAAVRFFSNTVSSILGETAMRGMSTVMKSEFRGSSSPLLARTMGAGKGVNQAMKNFKNQFKYGSMDYNGELTSANSLNSVRLWKKMMNDKGLKRIMTGLSAVVNMHPDVIQRTLGATDTFVHTLVLTSELNSIAAAKGLTGAEKTAFMMKPDEKSMEVALKKADKATYRNAPEIMGFSPNIGVLNVDPRAISKVMVDRGWNPTLAKLTAGLIQTGSILVFPFVKVPINILIRATKYALPEMTLAKGLADAFHEKDPMFRQRKITENLGDVTAGFLLRQIALNMVAHGMISLGYKDEDAKFGDARENVVGGPNQMNWSMFIRGLTFQDMTPRKTDTMISLTSVGSLGLTMGAYAHAFGKFSKQEREDMTEYSRNASNALSVPTRLFGAEVQSMLDYTFLSGTNQLIDALKGEGSKGEQFAINSIGTLFMGIVPATEQKLSTPSEPEVKKVFDKDLSFGENLSNSLGYKYAFRSSQLKNKYYSLATEDGVTKKRDYVLFDNYMGRAIISEFGALKSKQGYDKDQPITKLYDAAIDLPQEDRGKLFPNGIDRKQTFDGLSVNLNDEQWAYLQVQASNYRMLYATPFIMDPQFDAATADQKIEKLKQLYKEGLDQAKTDLLEKYPDILTGVEEQQAAEKEASAALEDEFMDNVGVQNQNFNN